MENNKGFINFLIIILMLAASVPTFYVLSKRNLDDKTKGEMDGDYSVKKELETINETKFNPNRTMFDEFKPSSYSDINENENKNETKGFVLEKDIDEALKLLKETDKVGNINTELDIIKSAFGMQGLISDTDFVINDDMKYSCRFLIYKAKDHIYFLGFFNNNNNTYKDGNSTAKFYKINLKKGDLDAANKELKNGEFDLFRIIEVNTEMFMDDILNK